MPIAELLQQTRFLTNNLGEQTDVVIPIDAWNDVIALVENLQSIDETHWIQQAQQARRDSEMVGTDRFTQEIIRLASLDESSNHISPAQRDRSPRVPGQYAGKLIIPDDFNDPLPDDITDRPFPRSSSGYPSQSS